MIKDTSEEEKCKVVSSLDHVCIKILDLEFARIVDVDQARKYL